MKLLPKYNVLSSNYPNKHDVPAKTLLDTIGGDVRKTIADSMNTCAIRISDMLNRSGRPIQKMAGLRQLKGAKPQGGLGSHGTQPSLYIVRVLDLQPECEGQCYWWTQGGSMKAYLWEATP